MEENKCCSTCCETKTFDKFTKGKNSCKDCLNKKRRERLKNNHELLIKKREYEKKYDIKKSIEAQKQKMHTQNEMGIDNKKCIVCKEIKHKKMFNTDRRKCKECNKKGIDKELHNKQNKLWYQKNKININPKQRERQFLNYHNNPIYKFIRLQRSRIVCALNNKQARTVDYLGCSGKDLNEWLRYNFDEKYSFENHGTFWHIDHVIPISTFDLEDPTHQFLCLNWRNTVPLSAKENLSKNNKIIPQQVEQHYKKLLLYHQEKKIDFPQEFIDLFMQHAQIDGDPLKI